MFSFFKPKMHRVLEAGPINVGKQSFKVYYLDEGNNKQIMEGTIYGSLRHSLFDMDVSDMFFKLGYVKYNKIVIPMKQVIKIQLEDIQDHYISE